jgi:hypothetical protein
MGCDANQLYLAYRTNVGVNASVSPEMTEGQLLVGYRRDFATVVPKSVPVRAGTIQRDVMSAPVCSELVVDGIWLNSYVEYLATGAAGKKFAENLRDGKGQVGDFFLCYKRPSAQSQASGTQ